MGEKENAMRQGELIRYDETSIESDMLAEAEAITNKKELLRRTNNGITVVAYWHEAEDVVSIYAHDTRTNQATEFIVPNDEVLDWFNHPYAHRDAEVEGYSQNQNGRGYGA